MNEIKTKVLVVEDEEPIRRFITLNLSATGYEIGEADTGEKALDMLGSFRPDVIVLDLMLPGISGLEVCQQVREKMPETFVIMLTAKWQDTDKILGLELGADDYMVKPFNPIELIARIKAMLRRVAQPISRRKIIYWHAMICYWISLPINFLKIILKSN